MNQEKNTPPSESEPVEVVDASGRTLAVMPASEAHRQSLPHRAALVLFFDRQGKLLLGRRFKTSQVFPGRWDLTARGHVHPQEAALDAASRLAGAEFPGLGGQLTRHCDIAPSEHTGFEAVAVFRYPAHGERGHSGREMLAVSEEELAALILDFRELISPTVVHAYETGVLFGKP
ncbi:NUDIX domain-containing protein [Fundidesulfovibrio terrae]|uniref:NUDIX domain-containing protein n=1 Tax=Fundidesulfovibrio terrae TaxID=2922866 RepID=UPI001FAF0792